MTPKLELSEAVRIWMHHCYGWPLNPTQKLDSREYHADRRKALADLKPIARPETHTIERTVARPSLRWGVPGRGEPQQQTITTHRVDREDLIRLASDYGMDLNVDAATSSDDIPDIEIRSPGHPDVNSDAVLFVLELERTGKAASRMDACRKAVERYFKDHHDPEGKAKSIAASVRSRRKQ